MRLHIQLHLNSVSPVGELCHTSSNETEKKGAFCLLLSACARERALLNDPALRLHRHVYSLSVNNTSIWQTLSSVNTAAAERDIDTERARQRARDRQRERDSQIEEVIEMLLLLPELLKAASRMRLCGGRLKLSMPRTLQTGLNTATRLRLLAIPHSPPHRRLLALVKPYYAQNGEEFVTD